jgi:hypothetical protein
MRDTAVYNNFMLDIAPYVNGGVQERGSRPILVSSWLGRYF